MTKQLEANHITPNLFNLPLDPGDKPFVNKMVYGDKNVKSILFSFSPGGVLAQHASPHPAILHFLEGEAEVLVGDKTIKTQAGTWVEMPAHLTHSISAKTAVKMLLLVLSS